MNIKRISAGRVGASALAALLIPLVISCVSCGSSTGSGSGGASSRAGALTLTVHWPSRSRLIPAASNSIRAVLKLGTATIDTKLLPRPGNGASEASVTYPGLNPGDYVLSATALPVADGTGVAQAVGSAPATVVAGQTTSVTVTMDSTIDHITVTPANPSITVGSDLQLTATAYDVQNHVVLVVPGNISWLSADTSRFTVTSGGLVHGVAATTSPTLVAAKEAESKIIGNTRVTVTAVQGCTPGNLPGAGALANSGWPRLGHDNANSSLGAGSGATGVLKYSVDTAAGGTSTPVLAPDGTLYVGSNVDHKLRAINSSDGSLKWSYTTVAGITQTPLVGSNGWVYIAESNTSLSNFYALDANGVKKWSTPLQDPLTPAIGSDGTIYVPILNHLVALDGTTGAQKWSFAASGNLVVAVGAPAVNPADGTVIYSGQDGNLHGLDPICGQTRWTHTFNATGLSQPTISNGAIYVHVGLKLYKLSLTTGAEIWNADIAGGGFSMPAVGADGTIFVVGGFGQLYAFNPSSSTPLWSYSPSVTTFNAAAIAVGSDNTVYYTGNGSTYHLFAVNGTTGALKWQYTLPQSSPPGFSSPIVDAAGVIYLRTYLDGKLWAIQ